MCKKENDCGVQNARKSCWCFSVVFPEDLKEKLDSDYDASACICQSCFEKNTAKSKAVEEVVK